MSARTIRTALSFPFAFLPAAVARTVARAAARAVGLGVGLAVALSVLAAPPVASAAVSDPREALVELRGPSGTPIGVAFAVSADGLLLTSATAIADRPPVSALLADGSLHDRVAVLGIDPRRDLAILDLPVDGVLFLELVTERAADGNAERATDGNAESSVRVVLARRDRPTWSREPDGYELVEALLTGRTMKEGSARLGLRCPGQPRPGSPVLDAEGRVIGMVRTAPGADGEAEATPAADLAGLVGDALAGRLVPLAGASMAPAGARPSDVSAASADSAGSGVAAAAQVPVASAGRAGSAVPVAAAVPAAPRTLRDVRRVAVYPFTSGGNVDTFATALFMNRIDAGKSPFDVVDPYELSVAIPDGRPFHPRGQLEELLADARRVGADAIIIGEGLWYSLGFRIELRMIDSVDGKVLWRATASSGLALSGPSAKREVIRDVVRDLGRTLRRR